MKFDSLEAGQEAQKAKAAQVKEAKAALKSYFSENKLKMAEDYSDDPKHGKKVMRLESKVDKYSDELNDINEALKKMKPGKAKASGEGKAKNLKYDYPEDVKTAEQRKKYRIEQRKLATGGTTKKASSKDKPAKKVDEVQAEDTGKKPAKKATVKSKAPADKVSTKVAKKKPTSKKVTPVEEGDDD